MSCLRILVYVMGFWTAFQFLEGILEASADVKATVHCLVGLTVVLVAFFLVLKCQKYSDCKTKKTD